jgi:hypothetical protein
MPFSSELPVLTPEQAKAAILKAYNQLQWECVLEVFGPSYDFERLLSLHRAMNALERRDPGLKQEYFLRARIPSRGRMQ